MQLRDANMIIHKIQAEGCEYLHEEAQQLYERANCGLLKFPLQESLVSNFGSSAFIQLWFTITTAAFPPETQWDKLWFLPETDASKSFHVLTKSFSEHHF